MATMNGFPKVLYAYDKGADTKRDHLLLHYPVDCTTIKGEGGVQAFISDKVWRPRQSFRPDQIRN